MPLSASAHMVHVRHMQLASVRLKPNLWWNLQEYFLTTVMSQVPLLVLSKTIKYLCVTVENLVQVRTHLRCSLSFHSVSLLDKCATGCHTDTVPCHAGH